MAGVDLVADAEHGIVDGDVATAGAWQEHMAGSDLVIHTAAVVSNAVDLDTCWRVNVLGTRTVIAAAAQAGVGRVVHISSIRAFSDLGYPGRRGRAAPRPHRRQRLRRHQGRQRAGRAAGARRRRGGRARSSDPATCTGRARAPGRCCRWRSSRPTGSCCRRWAGASSARCTSTTSSTACGSPASNRRRPGQVFTLTATGSASSCRDFFSHYLRMLGKRGPVLPADAGGGSRSPAVAGALERLRGRQSPRSTPSRCATSRARDLLDRQGASAARLRAGGLARRGHAAHRGLAARTGAAVTRHWGWRWRRSWRLLRARSRDRTWSC